MHKLDVEIDNRNNWLYKWRIVIKILSAKVDSGNIWWKKWVSWVWIKCKHEKMLGVGGDK